MQLFRIVFLGFCLVLASSCRTKSGSGDLADFLVKRIASYGGNMPTQTFSPVLHGKWSATEDRFGVVVRSDQISFERIDRFLKDSYGSPAFAGKTPDGQTQWVISAKSAGVAIWYAKENGGVRVTINRQLNLN